MVLEEESIKRVICLHNCGTAMAAMAAAGIDPILPIVLGFLAAAIRRLTLHTELCVKFPYEDLQELKLFDLQLHSNDDERTFEVRLAPCPEIMSITNLSEKGH